MKIFWTLMLWLVLLKMRLARIALANLRAYRYVNDPIPTFNGQWTTQVSSTHLIAYLFLILSWKIDEMIVFGANQEGNSSLVEASTLSVPLLDAVERRLPRKVEHEEDGNSVITDERKHVDELALTTKIPDGEGDFGIAYRDCLFHEVDTCNTSVAGP